MFGLAVRLVRHAALSFLGTAAALALFAAETAGPSATPAPTPSATTVRSWTLRLGFAALTKPLPRDRPWVWLIDQTMQIGAVKLFVIVGLPLADVPFGQRPLQLSYLRLAAMVPMTDTTFPRVAEALEAAAARTGAPAQIVSDAASELTKGIARFQEAHPQTVGTADAAHHVANLLKHAWEGDGRWTEYVRRMSAAAAAMRQTAAARWRPPKLRNQARFMSAGVLVRFGRWLLSKLSAAAPDPAATRHYQWVLEFAPALAAWSAQHESAQALLRRVRVEGLTADGAEQVAAAWPALEPDACPSIAAFRQRLRDYLETQSRGLAGAARRVGSTEVMESAFGVQKRLARDQSGDGLTALCLGLGAMLGPATPASLLADAERAPEKAVTARAAATLGPTVQWERRWLFRAAAPVVSEPIPG